MSVMGFMKLEAEQMFSNLLQNSLLDFKRWCERSYSHRNAWVQNSLQVCGQVRGYDIRDTRRLKLPLISMLTYKRFNTRL